MAYTNDVQTLPECVDERWIGRERENELLMLPGDWGNICSRLYVITLLRPSSSFPFLMAGKTKCRD